MYFYLKWEDRRPDTIKLLNEIPEKINFSETFKVKGDEVTICGWINPTFYTYYPPVKKTHKKSQYLSSHLQKCIRRMDDVKSIKTAKNFIDFNENNFSVDIRSRDLFVNNSTDIDQVYMMKFELGLVFNSFKVTYNLINPYKDYYERRAI